MQKQIKNNFLHLSTYKFTNIHDVEYLKNIYWKLCFELQLKGAIVFSQEGFNLMMAGTIPNMKKLINFLNQDPRFKNLPNKISYCDHNPFKRLQIKFKQLLVPTIDAKTKEDFPAPYLAPKDFKRWMDQNKTDVKVHVLNFNMIFMSSPLRVLTPRYPFR